MIEILKDIARDGIIATHDFLKEVDQAAGRYLNQVLIPKCQEIVGTYIEPKWNAHITPFIDNVVLPKLNAFDQAHISPLLERFAFKVENIIHINNRAAETYRRIEYDFDNATLLNNSAKLLIICAVLEMQDRIRTKYLDMADVALTNSWDEFSTASEKFYASSESMYLDLGDAAIPQISLDSWYSDLTLVKHQDGSTEYISLNDLIGD